jgi:probable rRNA maturation factor
MMLAARSALKIDVLVDCDRWNDTVKLKSIVRRAVTRAAAVTGAMGVEVAIVLTDDSAIRTLNRDWRGIDAATNVLSFPAEDTHGDRHLGDIVLAFETIAQEARLEHKPFADHVAHLAVHGYLHLVGFDHERDKDATAMENVERKILGQLAIPDPYRFSAELAVQRFAKNPAKRAAKKRVRRRSKS